MLSTKEILGYAQDLKKVSEKKQFSLAKAKSVGDDLGITWDKFDIEQFWMGLNIELEHGRRDHDEPIVTGKIALAHLKEIPNFYSQLVAGVAFVLDAQQAKMPTARTISGGQNDSPSQGRSSLSLQHHSMDGGQPHLMLTNVQILSVEELISEIRLRNASALRELFRRYAPSLKAFVLHRE